MEKVTCWSEYTLHPNRQGNSPWEREKYGEVSQSLNRKDSSWRESDWNLFSNETNSAVPREDSSDKQRITSKYTNVNTKKEYFLELSEKVKVEVSIGFSGKMAQLKVEWESESGRSVTKWQWSSAPDRENAPLKVGKERKGVIRKWSPALERQAAPLKVG